MLVYTGTATVVSYLPKKNKNMVLLSTLHTEAEISDCQDRRPVIILDYNCNKGGVDNLDKVIGTYSCRRMTVHWPLVIFHNIIDVSSYNTFVIWREINPSWMPGKRNKRVFLEQLAKALVTPVIERARVRDQPEHPVPLATSPVAPSKRKRCQMCPRGVHRVRGQQEG
ncbi:piggyBac transposable element-derived protein 4-like protein [Lates japonicus]|uniref:PiggyBac transposable element-derived protein 4-like protein n=1 Tax=Lates japonicus TaxID=270547 RepID=A0AAD3NH67_LATJO|nr:piggyBac transposable element-derived protein 4-like protein [Lates japonicus]